MKTNFFTVLLLATFSSLLFSCAEEEKPKEVLPEYDRADSLNMDYLRELGNIRVSIEQTAKLYKLLLEEGYSYNGSLPVSSSKSFSGSKNQAIGLGATSAAMNYAAVFEQQQDAMGYVKQIMNTSNQLGIGSAFKEDMLAKMAETDSTVDKSILLTKAYLRAEDQLYNEERAQFATLMVVGGWIEGLYISTSLVSEKPGNNEVNGAIWNQAYTYKNVMSMLKAWAENNADCKDVMEKVKGAGKAVNMIIQTNGSPNAAQIKELNAAIGQLRKDLIG